SAARRRDGQTWPVAMGGRTVQLKNGPGLAYLAALVRAPGREFHVLDLSVGTDAARQAYASDAGELLDAPARAAYKRRLLDLETELKDGERCNETGRLARARPEREVRQRR